MRNQYSEGKLKLYIILDEKELVQIKKKNFNCNKKLSKHYQRIMELVYY